MEKATERERRHAGREVLKILEEKKTIKRSHQKSLDVKTIFFSFFYLRQIERETCH